MARQLLFVAGAHGSGKGAICRFLHDKYLCDYISASSLIHWDTKTKLVEDVDKNQRKLLQLMLQQTIYDYNYIVDGHFVLLDKEKNFRKVNDYFFQSIKPSAIVLVTCNPTKISERLQSRDNLYYSVELIEKLQIEETEQAKYISKLLDIPLVLVDTSNQVDYKLLILKVDPIMAKYSRNNIYSEMLKAVIMRLDFSGATDVSSVVDRIKKLDCIKTSFSSMRTFFKQNNKINLRPKNLDNNELPVGKMQNGTVYQFTDCKIQKGCPARLEIDDSSIVLVVECNENYQGSAMFTNLFIETIDELKKFDQYIVFERLGIRKIDIQVIRPEEKISDYFNEHFVVSNSWVNQPEKKLSSLTELLTIADVNFNIVQRIDKVKEKENVLCRLIYDIDSYIEESTLADFSKHKISDYMNDKMQNKMFELFVNVASTKYLEKSFENKAKLNG